MRLTLCALAELFLCGCAGTFNTMVKTLPSVQDCQKVDYQRDGNKVLITAECYVPVGDSSLLSIPVKP